MTDRFLRFIPFVLKHETEYDKHGNVITENDPSDPGGRTRYGIDARSHPGVDIDSLTEESAREIYFNEWTDAKCQAMPSKLGEAHFDAVVNTGSGRAKRFLDASHGDAKQYNIQRTAFYYRLAAARPSSQKYLKGWLRRVSDLNTFLGIT